MSRVRTHRDGAPLLVAGIAAGAGGLDALQQLLSELPGDSGLALVLAPDADFADGGLVAQTLQAHTTMTIATAEHGAALRGGTLYVGEPCHPIAVRDGAIDLGEPPVYPMTCATPRKSSRWPTRTCWHRTRLRPR